MITALLLTSWALDGTNPPANRLRLLVDHPLSLAGEEVEEVTGQLGDRIPPDRNVAIVRVTYDNARVAEILADPNVLLLRRFDTQPEDGLLTPAQRTSLRNWLTARGVTLAEVQEWAGTDANLATLTRGQIYQGLRAWLRGRAKAAS